MTAPQAQRPTQSPAWSWSAPAVRADGGAAPRHSPNCSGPMVPISPCRASSREPGGQTTDSANHCGPEACRSVTWKEAGRGWLVRVVRAAEGCPQLRHGGSVHKLAFTHTSVISPNHKTVPYTSRRTMTWDPSRVRAKRFFHLSSTIHSTDWRACEAGSA
jgi:hypothetical protein